MSDEARRQTLGKKGFAYRYPRGFIVTGVTIASCIMFSKPLYDIFFAEPQPEKKINPNLKMQDRF